MKNPLTSVTATDLSAAIRILDLSGRPVCVHSSLRSFGWVEGGAATVVDALLGAGCTVMVPTFSESHGPVYPPEGRMLKQNAMSLDFLEETRADSSWRFSRDSLAVDPDMGAISAEVLRRPGRVRGNHPRDSLSAVGPLAHELIDGQRPLDVFSPFRALAGLGGAVVLMGVGLNRLTLLHEAERQAGRRCFRRWGRGPGGEVVECEEGGCSSGFENFAPFLAGIERQIRVGESLWRVLPTRETLIAAVKALQQNPTISHCDDPDCDRCADAIAGGPILPEDQ
jgi:aminoglycoside N3'-acetyltransferase